ncbi:MAG: phosphodiester glycosidase family protein [Evtepia sp.]|uniref:phosphodiester glycosidase family protein n=1 Tax=Evtepia sp. TaxID=2773933 RepID=UPI002A75C828|nr:phosphodiester glycosidase family protein [Evtepia sp.]MDY3014997.1 phosphodiester glycosidase family protein [Evtepia sp.]
MKPFLRRAAALVLCAALLCPVALASDALGSRIYSYTIPICDQTTLTKEVMWSASRKDLRTENYVMYKPSPSVSPKVSYGSSVLTKQNVYSMAKDLEKGDQRVLSGINGDYFVMATGDPLGLVVTDGILRSSASYLHALGFRSDGSAVIGTPQLTLRADFKGYSLKISEINKIRSTGGYYLFTDDFSSTTKNTKPGIDVILSPVKQQEGKPVTGADGVTQLTTSNDLGIGHMVSCKVEQVIETNGGATPIPEGKYILSIANTGNDWLKDMLRSLQPGDSMDFEIFSADSRWNDVDCAVGAMYWILSNGKVASGLDSVTAAPRTAVGVKPDGSVIFYTIDGRQSGLSIGATIQMVAMRLKELGCSEAVLLDGGGSTTMVSTYPDYTTSTTINSPSEGVPRAVTNAIFLVSNLDPTGVPSSLYVTPTSLTLLSGATTQCTASGVDTGWYPMKDFPSSVTWSSPENAVSDSGVFTAPAKTGVYTVSASSGTASGSTKIQVYDTPDAIYVKNAATGKNVSSLTLKPGQTVDLNASAYYRTIPLTGDDRCFSWTADPALGTITPDGKFTAGLNPASGKIKVAAGRYAVTLSVTVNAPGSYTLLSDFEGTTPYFSSSSAKLSLDTTPAQVQYGRQSLRADYTMRQGQAALTARQDLKETHRFLSLWVYGDNSGNTLTADFVGTQGEALTQPVTTLNFTGWKQVSAPVPANAALFQGLTIQGSKASGTLWLDQVVLANQAAWDTKAPVVSSQISGTTLKASLSDNAEHALDQSRITVSMDGKAVPFSWNGSTLTASLPSLGTQSHQVTVTATDCCGNIGRDSVALMGKDTSNPFADMTNHWATPYTIRLHQAGVISGMTVGGKLCFCPDQSITRGDFALMTARWMGLDLKAYQSVQLPYDDVNAIPAWDLDAIKALHALGIMEGSRSGDGRLLANATSSITRAEAMTILGRTQAKGHPQASLSGFSDAASVPAFARPHMASLVGQKVVGGSGGKLFPNAPVTRAEVAKMLFSLW